MNTTPIVEQLTHKRQAELNGAVQARQREVHEKSDVRRRESKGGGIRAMYSFPSECWFNAKQAGMNLKDPEYLAYEARKNPEFNAVFEERMPSFSLQHLTPSGSTKRRNRFGNVSFCKRYN